MTLAAKHAALWGAIDRLAKKHGMSCRALAICAGLDPSSLRQSDRSYANGKPRWPSTETVALILDATGASLADFFALIEAECEARQPEPSEREQLEVAVASLERTWVDQRGLGVPA